MHVFEARPTAGGRANTFRDAATGERIDNGQHVLAGCYVETLKFLARVGSLHRLHRPSTLRVPAIDERGRRTELALPPLPPPLNLLGGVLAWEVLTLADRWALLKIGPAVQGHRPVFADETVRQWLARHHQTPRLCALLWEPLALAALNQSIDQATAPMFVAVTSRMFSDVPDAAALLIPAVPLDDLYVHPATQYLIGRGGSLTTGAKAHIAVDRAGILTVHHGDVELQAPAVICSVPWFAAEGVFPDPPAALQPVLRNAAALRSAPIVTVNVWFDHLESDDVMVGLPGRQFQWVFDRRRIIGDSQTHLSLVSSGAEAIAALPNEEVIGIATREIREALGKVAAARVRHASVVRERRATFSLAAGGPPRPATSTGVKGLFLAGDWIDTGLPATIESAVVSGHRAAAAALAMLA